MNTDHKDKTRFEIHKIDGQQLRKSLSRRISMYERRYEIASSEMLKHLSAGTIRETAEVLRWMQAYHALKFVEQRIPMTGTRTKAIA